MYCGVGIKCTAVASAHVLRCSHVLSCSHVLKSDFCALIRVGLCKDCQAAHLTHTLAWFERYEIPDTARVITSRAPRGAYDA
jgi:hypothetical protein